MVQALSIYPFHIALSSWINEDRGTQKIEEKSRITIIRLKNAFIEFAKE